jgi:hypothetical protein
MVMQEEVQVILLLHLLLLAFTTAAGSLGTIAGNFSGTVATIAGSSDSVQLLFLKQQMY